MILVGLLTLIFGLTANAPIARADDGISAEGEAGIVSSSGNASSQTYNVKQATQYVFTGNTFKLGGHFLTSIARGTENSRNWDLVLRYERSLYEELSTYLSQGVEADVFAGYTQRYNTDAGAKYTLIKQKELNWSVEGGYRLSIQNAINGTKRTDHFLRAYTEVNKMWTETFSVRYWVEALPNVTESEGFRINTELSGVATLSSIFSLKAGYGIRFNNLPPAGAPYKTDSVFTTALVAKFSPETK